MQKKLTVVTMGEIVCCYSFKLSLNIPINKTQTGIVSEVL